MTIKKDNGDIAEQFVVDNIECPACGQGLTLLPQGTPLFDVRCSKCQFRAQVKYSSGKPGSSVKGGAWGVINGQIKGGNLVPPLFVYHAVDPIHPIVSFYPFVPCSNIKKGNKPIPSHKNSYFMSSFVGLKGVPSYEYEF